MQDLSKLVCTVRPCFARFILTTMSRYTTRTRRGRAVTTSAPKIRAPFARLPRPYAYVYVWSQFAFVTSMAPTALIPRARHRRYQERHLRPEFPFLLLCFVSILYVLTFEPSMLTCPLCMLIHPPSIRLICALDTCILSDSTRLNWTRSRTYQALPADAHGQARWG